MRPILVIKGAIRPTLRELNVKLKADNRKLKRRIRALEGELQHRRG